MIQDDYGMEPAIDGDNLDGSAEAKLPPTPAAGEQSASAPTSKTDASSEGLSLIHKLFFVGVIVSVCVLFLHSRRGSGPDAVYKEKSMA